MGRPKVERDPRRSLVIGGLVAAAILFVLFAVVLIGIVTVVAARQSSRSLGAATESSAMPWMPRPFERDMAV